MNILVVSKGIIHPSFLSRKCLNLLLKKLGNGFTLNIAASLKGLNKLGEGNYDAVILYYHEKNISSELFDCIRKFTENGGGVLALHSSMASFKQNTRYQELLGGKFESHDKIKTIDVFARDKDHPIAEGIDGFTVRDELYIHECHQDIEVVLACENNGWAEPVLWTKNYGRGRVCYFAPGHCPNVWLNSAVRKVIHNSLLWVGRREDRNA